MDMAPLNAPGEWDAMISYTQCNAEAKVMAEAVYHAFRERGKTVWLDIKMEQLNADAMREAAQNSKCIVAVVTGPCFAPDDLERSGDAEKNSYFQRPYCMNELRWAREVGVPIQPIIRREDKGRIGDFLAQAPQDLKDLGGVDFKAVDSISPMVWEACINDLLKNVERMIAKAESSIPEGVPTPPVQLPIAVKRGSPEWQDDADAPTCTRCGRGFSWYWHQHHCRGCGKVFCGA
jgi:hypothetical protein